jgi:hypothetical protein
VHVHVLYAHEEPRADQRSEYLAKHGEEIKFTEIPCALPPRRASGRGGWSCTFEDRYNDIRMLRNRESPILSYPPLSQSH